MVKITLPLKKQQVFKWYNKGSVIIANTNMLLLSTYLFSRTISRNIMHNINASKLFHNRSLTIEVLTKPCAKRILLCY